MGDRWTYRQTDATKYNISLLCGPTGSIKRRYYMSMVRLEFYLAGEVLGINHSACSLNMVKGYFLYCLNFKTAENP